MRKIENEEFSVDEIQRIDEIQYFKAEEFGVKEVIDNTMEDFKVKEVQERIIDESFNKKKIENTDTIRKKLEGIKSTINTAATTTVTASVIAFTVLGVGTIVSKPDISDIPDTPEIDDNYGMLEYINYCIEYEELEAELTRNVKINFKKELNDGFYTIIVNKENEEIQNLNYDHITFYNIDENTTFEVITKNDENIVVDSFEIPISTISSIQYLGIGNMNYELIKNSDNSFNLEMILDEYSKDLIPKAYLSDLDGNDLDYESIYYDNKLVIKDIKDKQFHLNAFLYKEENNNYFAVQSYKIHNYNLENPINANIKRVEVLNQSYSYDESIPTQIYIDGYLSNEDYLDLKIYNESGEIIDKSLNIKDLRFPITFSDLTTAEEVMFEYTLYHYGNIIKKGNYQTSLAIKEEYLDASFEFGSPNPGDTFVTFNKNGTYNAYFYSSFSNNSNYDMVYKVELNDGNVSHYEYIGNDFVAYIYDIDSKEQFSLINKVMIRENKTYYAIYDFYLASGTFGVGKLEDGTWDLPVYLDVYETDIKKIYQFQSYESFGSDLLVTAALSTGQTLEFVIPKDTLSNYDNYPTIDLTDYEYESVMFTVKVLANPIYGMGDYILETGVDIKGDIYTEVVLEFEL